MSVRSIPATASRWQISTGAGSMPRWRHDGRELFYRAPDGTLMAVAVEPSEPEDTATFRYGRAQEAVLKGCPTAAAASTPSINRLTDGQRFLVNGLLGDSSPSLTVVVDWQAGLER